MELRLHWINGIIMLLKGRKSALLEDSTEKIINSLSYDKLKNKISEESLEQSDYVLTIQTDKTGLLDVEKMDSCYQYGYKAVLQNLSQIKNFILGRG